VLERISGGGIGSEMKQKVAGQEHGDRQSGMWRLQVRKWLPGSVRIWHGGASNSDGGDARASTATGCMRPRIQMAPTGTRWIRGADRPTP
jgi:hypothetical protein